MVIPVVTTLQVGIDVAPRVRIQSQVGNQKQLTAPRVRDSAEWLHDTAKRKKPFGTTHVRRPRTNFRDLRGRSLDAVAEVQEGPPCVGWLDGEALHID